MLLNLLPYPPHLLLGQLLQHLLQLKTASKSIVDKCIYVSAPKSCDLDPISYELLMECLYSKLTCLIDIFMHCLASGMFPQRF